MTGACEVDTLVVGGGVVGMAVAYGLAGAGDRVRVLDEGDDAFRAARGNFGLVWVSGKGLHHLPYARWSRTSAQRWAGFARELSSSTGIDLELAQIGGVTLCLDEADLARRALELQTLREAIGGAYPFEVLDSAQLRRLEPFAGPEVVGGIYSPMDGHVSPLRLLRALVRGFQLRGGELHSGARCVQLEYRGGAFHGRAGGVEHVAGRVVLAAGLGNRALAPMVGLKAPLVPNRGQVLVTERVRPFLRHPSPQVRQTGEGTVQIGDSQEDVGMDEGTTIAEVGRIARQAIRYFPLLRDVNLVRSWGALRVMTSDGLPIYEASAQCPGAYLVAGHSGITLAAQHSGPIAQWIRGGEAPADARTFTPARFENPAPPSHERGEPLRQEAH